MTDNCAVQIVEHLLKGEFEVNEEAVKEIYGNKRVADLPLVVLCIAGAARTGKSFLLNFFLDYLIHKEQHPNEEWQLNDNTQLAGFEFREGEDRTTLGIWAWNHIFIVEQEDGKKIAVSLIDSQGTVDSSTLYQDSSTIFAMTSLFSSIMCFNVFTDLQEDKLNDLSTFVRHAQMIVENLGGTGKLFQDFVFIIRDFGVKKYLDDENGGPKYLENVLGRVNVDGLQEARNILNASYEQKHGFIFRNPGEKVTEEKTSKISEVKEDFVNRAKTMVQILLSHSKLHVKKIGSSEIRCKDMCKYIPKLVKCFNDNKKSYDRHYENFMEVIKILTPVFKVGLGVGTIYCLFLKSKADDKFRDAALFMLNEATNNLQKLSEKEIVEQKSGFFEWCNSYNVAAPLVGAAASWTLAWVFCPVLKYWGFL